jgi:membrane-associated phospholipid phosphatase
MHMGNKIRSTKVVVYLVDSDRKLSRFIYSFKPESSLINNIIKLLTSGYGLSLLGLLSLLTTKNIILTIAVFAFIFIFNSIVVELMLKRIVKRARPGFTTNKLRSFSFPSTHAASVGMGIGHVLVNQSLYQFSPIVLPILMAWVLLIISSRVLYGHHYVFDVVFGLLLGLLFSLLFIPLNLYL